VGDSPADIRTAHNAGIPCIGVSWGYRDASELSEADHLVHSAEELRKLLLKPFNK
jgi:phosphoglycolate phosphatase